MNVYNQQSTSCDSFTHHRYIPFPCIIKCSKIEFQLICIQIGSLCNSGHSILHIWNNELMIFMHVQSTAKPTGTGNSFLLLVIFAIHQHHSRATHPNPYLDFNEDETRRNHEIDYYPIRFRLVKSIPHYCSVSSIIVICTRFPLYWFWNESNVLVKILCENFLIKMDHISSLDTQSN